MSRTRGKREAGRETWHTEGNPFEEENSKKPSGKRTALIVLGCVAALALVAVGLWKIFVVAPDVSDNDKPGVSDAGKLDAENGTEPETAAGRKEDYFTFLLLGKDTSSGSTDTIILVSYDVPNGTVNCMSIPRDTMVNVGWDIKRINSVYSAKESSGGKMEGLKTQVGYLTGIVPDFHVIIEWEAVGRLVDALGGVYFDVPYNMDYDDPYQDLYIHQEKGYRLLSGEDAMQVVRWRKNNDGTNYGDTVRVQVQQAFLKAVAQQCLQLKNWTKISEFAKIFFENVETDLPLNNLLWFAQQAMGVNMENVQFMTLPGDYEGWAWSRTYHNNQSYVFADSEAVAEMVNQYFNPYNRDITEDDLQIMYKNKDGSLGVTNGTLVDTKAASAPVKSSGSSGSSGSTTTEPVDDPTPPDESGEAAEPGGENTGGTGETGNGETTEPSGEPAETPEEGSEGDLPTDPEVPADGGTAGNSTDPGQDTGDTGGESEMPGWLG